MNIMAQNAVDSRKAAKFANKTLKADHDIHKKAKKHKKPLI